MCSLITLPTIGREQKTHCGAPCTQPQLPGREGGGVNGIHPSARPQRVRAQMHHELVSPHATRIPHFSVIL